MAFTGDGFAGLEADPGSFSPSPNVPWPVSAKTVFEPSTNVTTSDDSVFPNLPSAPDAPSSELMIRYDDAVPSSCMSPQPLHATATSNAPAMHDIPQTILARPALPACASDLMTNPSKCAA